MLTTAQLLFKKEFFNPWCGSMYANYHSEALVSSICLYDSSSLIFLDNSITKIDSLGNVVFSKVIDNRIFYTNTAGQHHVIYYKQLNFLQYSDNLFFIVGKKSDNDSVSSANYLTIMRTDSNFSSIGSNSLFLDSFINSVNKINSIVKAIDQTSILIGANCTFITGNTGIMLLKIDTSGLVLNSKYLAGNDSVTLTDMVVDSIGNLFLLSSYNDHDCIIKLDSNLNLVNAVENIHPQSSIPVFIDFKNSNTFTVGGYLNGVYQYTVDSSLNLYHPFRVVCDTTFGIMAIYPVASNTYIYASKFIYLSTYVRHEQRDFVLVDTSSIILDQKVLKKGIITYNSHSSPPWSQYGNVIKNKSGFMMIESYEVTFQSAPNHMEAQYVFQRDQFFNDCNSGPVGTPNYYIQPDTIISQAFSLTVGPISITAFVDSLHFIDSTGLFSCDLCTSYAGIDENFKGGSCNIYPIPSSSILNYISSSNFSLNIYDINGRLQITANVISGEGGIDISTLMNGTYFCHFSNERTVFVKKIVVVN